jgi:hypothetical protein
MTLAYRAPDDLPDADRAALDVLLKVLARLEPRLPADRRGVAVVGEPAADAGDAVAEGLARFPFARVERSEENGRALTEVLLRATPRCNQDCPFCSAPPSPEPSAESLAACLDWIGAALPGAAVTLTGGEPTLRPDLGDHVRHALSLPGITTVLMQTNAVGLAREGAVGALPIDPRLRFFASLHAVDEALYDRCTGTTGQFARAVDGIRALLAAGHDVTANVVVNALNAPHLGTLVDALPVLFAPRPPRLHLSIVMCPESRPGAADWLIRYTDLVPVLREAVARAEAAGVPHDALVSSTHASIPPCFVPPDLRAASHRPLLDADESGYEDPDRPWVKAARCRGCAATASCLGLPAPYVRRFGFDELQPLEAPW